MSNPDKMAVLAQLQKGEITVEQANALLTQAGGAGEIHCKVGKEKKGLSIYGLQRNPVTLYVDQWERIFANLDMIRKFIADHKAELVRKAK